MSNIKTAVICDKYQDFVWYITHHNKAKEKFVWVDKPEKVYGRYYNGYVMVGEKDNTLVLLLTKKGYEIASKYWTDKQINYIKELKEIIWYVETHRKMTCSEVLDYLDDKGKVLCWLIEGIDIHCLPLRAVDYLTVERICELYNVEPEYFEKYGKK